ASFVSLSTLSCRLRCFFFLHRYGSPVDLHSFPTRRSSDLLQLGGEHVEEHSHVGRVGTDGGGEEIEGEGVLAASIRADAADMGRSEEHTSELQSLTNIVCRLLLEKKNRHSSSSDKTDSANL